MTDVLSAPAAGAPSGAPIPAVRDYGDPAAEYAALRSGALLVDHSARDVWTFRGPQARATVAGLVTNDVVGLAAGQGCYAAALTPKGRIVADVRVFAVDDAPPPVGGAGWLDGASLVVDVPPRAAEGWEAVVRKFVNPRVTPYRRAGNAVRAFGIYGRHAREAVAAAFGAAPSALAALLPYAHATMTLGGDALLAARVPDAGGPGAGLDGFYFLLPAAAYDAAWARLAAAVPGVVAGGEAAYAAARVEAGYPEWGVDIDETTIPQEANFDELGAISYTKGCYTGQEVVARVHFRGHVNRHLRGVAYPVRDAPSRAGGPARGHGPVLLLDGTAARAASTAAPGARDDGEDEEALDLLVPAGAHLFDESGKLVGDVRSSVRSPRLGGVALAMIRREVAPDAVLSARWADGDGATAHRRVTVAGLPFPL